MQRQVTSFLFLALFAISAASLSGCDSSTGVPTFKYRPQTSPENVLLNLQDSYRRREIEPYKALLAPEFTFKVQPGDVSALGTDHFPRDEDIAGTNALFTSGDVADIVIDLVLSLPQAANDASLPADAVKIRANQVGLEVDDTAGTPWVVTAIEDFFLRPGRPSLGESADRWYLIEWREYPTTHSPGIRPDDEETTWGRLKVQYLATFQGNGF